MFRCSQPASQPTSQPTSQSARQADNHPSSPPLQTQGASDPTVPSISFSSASKERGFAVLRFRFDFRGRNRVPFNLPTNSFSPQYVRISKSTLAIFTTLSWCILSKMSFASFQIIPLSFPISPPYTSFLATPPFPNSSSSTFTSHFPFPNHPH